MSKTRLKNVGIGHQSQPQKRQILLFSFLGSLLRRIDISLPDSWIVSFYFLLFVPFLALFWISVSSIYVQLSFLNVHNFLKYIDNFVNTNYTFFFICMNIFLHKLYLIYKIKTLNVNKFSTILHTYSFFRIMYTILYMEMLTNTFRTWVNNSFKESFYKIKKINVLIIFFIFHKNGVKTFLK